IGERKGCRLLHGGVSHRQSLDTRRVDVAAAADDHILQTPGNAQVTGVVHPAEIAGHEPALRVERGLGGRLVVEIAEHWAGAAAADLADRARRGFNIRIVLAPDADLIAFAAAAAGVGDLLGQVAWQRVLVRAGFGHAVAALRHHAIAHQLGYDRDR